MNLKVVNRVLVPFMILLLISGLTACSTLQSLIPDPDPGQGDDQGLDPGDGEQGDLDDSGFEGESLGCFHAKNFVLSVDHTLTVNEAETSLTHILPQGSVALESEFNTDGHQAIIRTISPQTFSFEYLGTVGICSVDGNGEMMLSAEGFCDEGIVYLKIMENWLYTDTTMTCEDQKVSITLPGRSFTHSGSSGMGEEFLITKDAVGHTVMRPFQEGDGYHSWTLTMDISLVPLVPDS